MRRQAMLHAARKIVTGRVFVTGFIFKVPAPGSRILLFGMHVTLVNVSSPALEEATASSRLPLLMDCYVYGPSLVM